MVKVDILFFATVRDRLSKSQEKVTLPSNTWSSSAALLNHLCQHVYPCLQDLQSNLAVAVNEEYVIDGEVTLVDDDRLALIPPITGG